MRSLLASLGLGAAAASGARQLQSIPDAPWTAMEVDVPLNITLAPGECAAFRLELTSVQSGEERGLMVQYRSPSAQRAPTAGYVAYGLPAHHTDSVVSYNAAPFALGTDVASGCWATAADVPFGGTTAGVVRDLASSPASLTQTVQLPHDVPSDSPPSDCMLHAGEYYVYAKNGGAAPAELSMEATVQTAIFSCAAYAGDATTQEFWLLTMAIALGGVVGCFLLWTFIWYCVCSTTVSHQESSDEDDEGSFRFGGPDGADPRFGGPSPKQMLQMERQQQRQLAELEAQADAMYTSGDVSGAAKRYAEAAVLAPEGSAQRELLEQRLMKALEREKAAAAPPALEDRRRPDRYYEDAAQSGTDDEEAALGEGATVAAAKARAAAQLGNMPSGDPNLRSGAGRRQERQAREQRLKAGGGFNRTSGMGQGSPPARP